MSPEGIALVLGALGIGTIIAAIINKIRPKGERELALLEQVQEERERDHKRIEGLERRERVRDDYIMLLRQHIADGKPPPPPPYPSALTGEAIS